MVDVRGDDDDLSRQVGDARLLQRVFDQMPLLVAATLGAEVRVGAATAMYRAWGGRPGMVGELVSEGFPEIVGQQIFPIFDRVYATGRPEALREFRLQLDRPDTGERVEYFIDFNINPLFGPGQEIIGLIFDVVDVTERVKEQQATQRRAIEAERRYEQARDVIDALQRELLPPGVPVLPGVQIAASYLLADADTAAGGDWFDA